MNLIPCAEQAVCRKLIASFALLVAVTMAVLPRASAHDYDYDPADEKQPTVAVADGREQQPYTPLGKDVWCCSDDGQSFYLDSQSINAENLPRGMSYRVAVKEVRDSDGSLEQIIICGFESQNDVLVCSIFDQSAGLWNPVSIREYPALKGVWEIMKPYMKEKRISYSDSWMWDKKA